MEGAACCGLVAEDHDEIRGTCTNEAGNKSKRSTAKLLQQNRPYPAARQIFRIKKSTRPHFLILRRQLLRILFRRPTRLKAMLLNASTLMGLLATLGTTYASRKCATPDPPAELLAKSRELKAQADALKEAGVMVSKAPITVNAWFHVVSASETLADGNITVSAITSEYVPCDDQLRIRMRCFKTRSRF